MTNRQFYSFPKTLDNTTLSAAAKCPRQAYYRHFLHLQKGGVSIHLHAGKAYAAALEDYRIAYYDPDSPTHGDLWDSLVVGARRLLKDYGWDEEREADEYWANSPKSASRLLQTFIAHVIEYPPQTDPVQPLVIDGKPAIERSFTLEMDFNHPDADPALDLPILFHGRFDMLVEFAGQAFVFDDKTTSALGPRWRNQWDMRSQFTGYVMGAQTFNLPIAGAIVRGHCIQKTDVKFEQAISYRKPNQVDQWYDDAHAIAHTLIQYYERGKELDTGGLSHRAAFPQLGTFNGGCEDFGGCAFKELCEAKNPERWLSNYTIHEWDPMEPDAEREEVSADIIAKSS